MLHPEFIIPGRLYTGQHMNCFDFDRSPRPQIEVIAFKKGHSREVFINTNEIVFFVEGSVRQVFRDYPEYENSAGEFIFLPCGGKVSLTAQQDSLVTVLRLNKAFRFCPNFLPEDLYLPGTGEPPGGRIGCLYMDGHVSSFLEGVNRLIAGGMCCRHFFDLKVREFLLLLRFSYSREQLREFLKPILSADTAFSEYVRTNRDKYPTVKQMAASMNITAKVFTARFNRVFGTTPYHWMKQSKALAIHREIAGGKKSIKEIAAQNGFHSLPQFSRFCKKELGANPLRIRREQAGRHGSQGEEPTTGAPPEREDMVWDGGK